MTSSELKAAFLAYELRLSFTIKTDNGKQDLREAREALVDLLMSHEHVLPSDETDHQDTTRGVYEP